MQAAKGAILFCEMFHGDPKLFVKATCIHSMIILSQMCRTYCECFENKTFNYSLNLIHFYDI